MGSSGGKPRKGHEHQHLPKVGTRPNRDYEAREREKLVFGGWPIVVVAVVILILVIGLISVT